MSRRRFREVAQELADLAGTPGNGPERQAVVLAGLIRLAEESPVMLVRVLRRSGRDVRRAGLSPDLLP